MASKEFSIILKDLRIKAGYTQKQVYDHFNIPQSTFSSWEVGKSEPSGEMLIKLCEYYKCDIMKEFSAINNDVFTINEINHIKKYRSLDDHGKKTVDMILDSEYTRTTKKSSDGLDIEKELASYRKELELEKGVTEKSSALHTEKEA